jgi:hypothetical protein
MSRKARTKEAWQNTVYVLRLYAKKASTACRRYREFVKNGVSHGKRPRLVGGGLIRSLGAWSMDLKCNVLSPGKYKKIMQVRNIACYWAVCELGISQGVLLKNLKSVNLQ